MNAIEILGGLLGKKAGGSGAGADILKDILTGGGRRSAPPKSAPSKPSREPSSDDIERQARELEDLLNVATGKSAGRSQPPARPAGQPQTHQPAPRPPTEAPRQSGGGNLSEDRPFSQPFELPRDEAAAAQQEQAIVLVRAMLNAAKCDGQVSQAEQQSILSQLENPSPATLQFLRDELNKPLDVREFAWSVPLGLEQQVYTLSLIAIDVDSAREESYLRELAHGLRLRPEVCEQIKQRLIGGSPRLAGAR